MVSGIENFHNKNWNGFPMVVVSGNWLPRGEELEVREFDPVAARTYHEVIRSL